jgi:uncharacterized membrane protein
VHPFDLKTVLLAKHAQHVVLIHFPIALFVAGVALEFLGQWKKQPTFTDAARYNLLGAALISIPTAITGLIAWQWALEGQKLKGILLLHLILGWLSTVLIWLVWLIRARANRQSGAALPGYLLMLEVVAVAVVSLTGHLGGFLSGVNAP